MDPRTFELLCPSRLISFTFPNPNPGNHPYYSTPLLHFSVLDSPSSSAAGSSSISAAAMLVPVNRERDWIFSTLLGHLHLLLSCNCCRLILISRHQPEPDMTSDSDPKDLHIKEQQFQNSLLPLLLALTPKSSFLQGIPNIPFFDYHDDVSRIASVEELLAPTVGDLLVEDVQMNNGESQRRLRFKRMPNLVQSQVCLLDNNVIVGSLVHPYLGPMVAALYVLLPELGPKTKVLCIGVGGGDLLMCLRHQFGFNVLGVELDETVLSVAKKHFGLEEDEFLKVVIGDGIKFMEKGNVDFENTFDVIMVDLDSGDVLNGICAPPSEFVEKSVLLGARLKLCENGGILVVNVIVPNNGSDFYTRLVEHFREVFDILYEIDVGNSENYVLIASVSQVETARVEKKNIFLERLKIAGVDKFISRIKTI